MVGFRYRVYISYSHRDEAWVKWLQRALERYRVPRKLRGTRTSVGEVPPGISPVFRDWEDLSSAADLSSAIKQALARFLHMYSLSVEDVNQSRTGHARE